MHDSAIQPDSTSRYAFIDLLEAMAILMVLIYHGNTGYTDFVEVPTFARYAAYSVRGIVTTSVPLFFMANGFLLLPKPLNLKRHTIKTLRLAVLTVLWGAISLVLLSLMKQEPMTLRGFIHDLITWRYGWINHLWYMGALVCIYLLFPLIRSAYDHPKVFLWFTAVCCILSFGNTMLNGALTLLRTLLGHPPEDYMTANIFNMFNPLRGLYGFSVAYFCLGGLAHRYLPQITAIPAKRRNLIAGLVLLLSLCLLPAWGIFCSHLGGYRWDIGTRGHDTVFGLFATLSLFVLSLNYSGGDAAPHRFLRLISCNTLGIYFIHELLIHPTRATVWEIPLFCTLPGNVVYGFLLLCGSLLITLLLRKIPVLRQLVQ